MKRSAIFFITVLLSGLSLAQKDPDLQFQTVFGDYTVRHVVFNSTFIQPEVAKIYQIKRSKYESILNVSLSPKGQIGSIPAVVEGTVTNLMQQQRTLTFKEIREDNATYYIAPIRVANEEHLKFNLNVRPLDSDETIAVKFSQTVYADE